MTELKTAELDPISLEIYWNRLLAICDEAVTSLIRTAFSTIVRESKDCVSVIMDLDGDLLAENRGERSRLRGMPFSCDEGPPALFSAGNLASR